MLFKEYAELISELGKKKLPAGTLVIPNDYGLKLEVNKKTALVTVFPSNGAIVVNGIGFSTNKAAAGHAASLLEEKVGFLNKTEGGEVVIACEGGYIYNWNGEYILYDHDKLTRCGPQDVWFPWSREWKRPVDESSK